MNSDVPHAHSAGSAHAHQGALRTLPIWATLFVGAALASPPEVKHHHPDSAGVLSLDVFSGPNRLHVFFAEQRAGDPKPMLFHRRSDDAGESWREPVRVDAASPPPFSPHRGSDPQLAAAGDRLIAVWTTAGTDRWGSGPMATALSSDGGKTWKPGPNPADDGSTTGHGFIDITADAAGVFHLTWLDSRDGRQGLRYARSSDAGMTWSANATVKAQTCECCANTIATGPGGLVGILYRGHDPRDMHLGLSTDGGGRWSKEHRVGGFDWKLQGCPHVGGGLVFAGDEDPNIHALVWTGGAPQAGIFHLRLAKSGAGWSEPQRLAEDASTHPDLAADKSDRLAAVWEERSAVFAVLSHEGATWEAPARLSREGIPATHPRVLATTTGFRVFWTETSEAGVTVWRSAPVK